MSDFIPRANTFIYYKDELYNNVLGMKPKYEKNRMLNEYTEDDEKSKRYKYFLYEEAEIK